jgi:hypothetical protein
MNFFRRAIICFIKEIILECRQSVLFRIFISIYLITMILTISIGTYSLISNQNFNTWGWIVFVTGCVLLMIVVFNMIMVCFYECVDPTNINEINDKPEIIETTNDKKITVKKITSKKLGSNNVPSSKRILTSYVSKNASINIKNNK